MYGPKLPYYSLAQRPLLRHYIGRVGPRRRQGKARVNVKQGRAGKKAGQLWREGGSREGCGESRAGRS
jgi:hypothetical protein